MNIIEQNKEKINGILETFDRMIINGYILQLCNYRQFLYYLIQNDIKFKDFDKFALSQTEILCNHIDSYIKDNNCDITTNSFYFNKKRTFRSFHIFLVSRFCVLIFSRFDCGL